MPLGDDAGEAFVAAPNWRPEGMHEGALAPVVDEAALFPRRLGRPLMVAIALLIFLVLGALGLGYALSSWLGHGNFLPAPDVASQNKVPAVPESLAPTGAVGPPRLTVQSPLPVRTVLPSLALDYGSSSASAPVAASGAAAQAQLEASTASSELSRLLRRARRCQAEQDFECVHQNARSALRLDRQSAAARKLLDDAKTALAAGVAKPADASGATAVQPKPDAAPVADKDMAKAPPAKAPDAKDVLLPEPVAKEPAAQPSTANKEASKAMAKDVADKEIVVPREFSKQSGPDSAPPAGSLWAPAR